MKTNDEIMAYNGRLDNIDRITSSISKILESSQPLQQSVPQLINTFNNLMSEQMHLNNQLAQLELLMRNNLEKFKEIVSGAEKRLDRNLDSIDRWTELLLSRDLGSMDINEMNAQQMILKAIEDANDRFNNELDRLYSL